MKIVLILAALAVGSFAMFSAARAGTVPSTFDAGCNVNWVGGGCGVTPVGSGHPDARQDENPAPVSQPSPPSPCSKKA